MSERQVFSKKEDAEFSAWLMDKFVIPETISSINGKPNQYVIFSLEEIRQLITEAFEKNDQPTADLLLEIISKPSIISNEIIRKSIRLKSGEYLKLLYVKLLEETSFSDILRKILAPKALEFLDLFEKENSEKIGDKKRIIHLRAMIDSWNSMSPESRSKAIDMGLREYEAKNEIMPDYPFKMNNVSAISGFILSQLDEKLFLENKGIHRQKTKAYDELRDFWEKEINENPLSPISLKVNYDPSNSNQLVFQPTAHLSRSLSYEERQELFEKYGEENELGLIHNFNSSLNGEKIEFITELSENRGHLHYWIELELPTCRVKILDTDDFEVDSFPPKLTESMAKNWYNLQTFTENIGVKTGLNPSLFFKKEDDRVNRRAEKGANETSIIIDHVRSTSWMNFLKLATQLAKTPEDFEKIRRINTYRNRILDYDTIIVFTQDLVEASIRRHSVVSFYVNEDVWRFLPSVIKGQNWNTLIESYLFKKVV